MNKYNINNEAGYADLMPLRIMATILLVLLLIALPKYFDYAQRMKFMPVLESVQQSVEGHYKESRQLPDLEKFKQDVNNEYVDIHDGQITIDLTILESRGVSGVLEVHPALDKGDLKWECAFSGDIYRDDVPPIREGACKDVQLSLAERSFTDRAVNYAQDIWKLILGYVLFIVFTLLVG